MYSSSIIYNDVDISNNYTTMFDAPIVVVSSLPSTINSRRTTQEEEEVEGRNYHNPHPGGNSPTTTTRTGGVTRDDDAPSSQLQPLLYYDKKNILRPQNCPNDSVDFLQHVKLRQKRRKQRNKAVIPWPMQVLNDKWGFYVWAKRTMNLTVPAMLYCSDNLVVQKKTDGSNNNPTTTTALDNFHPTVANNKKGFAVKVKQGREANGIYLMESGFGGPELLSGNRNMTRQDVASAMLHKAEGVKLMRENRSGKLPFHIEELISSSSSSTAQSDPNDKAAKKKNNNNNIIPNDYKVFAANGEVWSVYMVQNRGTEKHCIASVDEKYQRLDQNGCFSNNERLLANVSTSKMTRPHYVATASSSPNNNCSVIPPEEAVDMPQGYQLACPLTEGPPAQWDKIIETAKYISRHIGIFARIDLYIQGDDDDGVDVVLGEATFLPFAGNHHCMSSTLLSSDGGCVDPCFLGRLWERNNMEFNTIEGGPLPDEPEAIKGWKTLSLKEQCRRVMEASRQ